MKSAILILILCFLSACNSATKKVDAQTTQGSEASSLENFCAENHCRKNRRVTFMTDGEPVDELLELYWPIVQGDKISLLPGDKIYVEAEIVDGMFSNFKQVEEIVNDEKTIVFDFQQMEGKVDMMLNVKNPFQKAVKFHVDMIDFKGNAHQTSSCPVMSGGGVYEHWPHAIPEIILSNIRAVELTDIAGCIY